MVGASKRRPSTAAVVGAGCAVGEGDLLSLPPLIREKVMKDKRKPAELIRTDLITAMKIPDTEHLDPESYWPIVDAWKTDYDKGVQVPVNPEGGPTILVKQRKDTTARDAILGPFSMPAKLISVNGGEKGLAGAMFDPERHEFCDAAAKTRQLEARPRYNLDQFDFAWLQLLNRERGACGLIELTEEVLEMVVDDLETRCHNNMTANQLGIEFDEDTQCDVCLSPDSEDGNEMVFCDACDLCVHQACYGIVTVPAGSWLCAPCARGYSAKPPCALCPLVDGALKPDADADLWAHVICALWIPEVTIGTPELMEPLQNLHRIPVWRRRLTCSVCSAEGQGACIQCSFENCKASYHVTCAQKAGLSLLMCAADVSNPLLELKSFCRAHVNYRSAALAPHRYKKVIEYGVQAASMSSKRNRLAASSSASSSAASTSADDDDDDDVDVDVTVDGAASSASGSNVGGQQFLDFVDPNETAAHLRQFVDPLGVDQIFNFWKLKRLGRQGRALLPPKHEENSGLQRPVQIDDELSNTIRSLVNLRQDLERARNLSYLVQRREKQRKLWIRAREDVTMGQLRAAEEHPESLRIIRTANRLDDIYDRLHSFEKVYGVPAASVVTSLRRTVERDNVKVHGGSPISRVPAPMTHSAVSRPLPVVSRDTGGHGGVVINPDRFRPPPAMSSTSPRGIEGRTMAKRRRDQHSPEGDENNAPFRVRTRLNFSTTVDVAPTTTIPPEKHQCTQSTTGHRTIRQRPSTPTTPIQSPGRVTTPISGTSNRSPQTPRTSPSSTAPLKFLRVGRRRGGPFKRSMIPDLQSGSPERPRPPTTAAAFRSPTASSRPTASSDEITASPTRPMSAPIVSSGSIRQHQQLQQYRQQSEQLHQRLLLPSGRLREDASTYGGTANVIGRGGGSNNAIHHSTAPSSARLGSSTSSAAAATGTVAIRTTGGGDFGDSMATTQRPRPESGLVDQRHRHHHRHHRQQAQPPYGSIGADSSRPSLAAAATGLRMTRGRRSLADTSVADLEGHFVRGTPRTVPSAGAVPSARSGSINNNNNNDSNNGNHNISIASCSSSRRSESSNSGSSCHSRSRSNRSSMSSSNNSTSDLRSNDVDSDTESVEILTGVDVLQLRTRSTPRTAAPLTQPPADTVALSSSTGATASGASNRKRHRDEQQLQQHPLPVRALNSRYSVRSPPVSASSMTGSAAKAVPGQAVALPSRAPSFNVHNSNSRHHHRTEGQQRQAEIRTLRSSKDKPARPTLSNSVVAVASPSNGVALHNGLAPMKKPVDITGLNHGVTTTSSGSSSSSIVSARFLPKSTEGRHSPVKAAQTHLSAGTTKAVVPIQPSSTIGSAFPAANESRRTRNRCCSNVTPNSASTLLEAPAEDALQTLTTPSSSPSKPHPLPSRQTAPTVEHLVLRSNARKIEGSDCSERSSAVSASDGSNGTTCGREGIESGNAAVQYSLCYFDCAVRLQRLSGAQLQRFVRIVHQPHNGSAGRTT